MISVGKKTFFRVGDTVMARGYNAVYVIIDHNGITAHLRPVSSTKNEGKDTSFELDLLYHFNPWKKS